METIFCLAKDKKFVYRGFLYGPYCPIYGVGAVGITAIFDFADFSPLVNGLIIFFGGFVFCSAVEYAGALVLEKIFGLKIWDYSNYPLNLHGRIWIGYSLWWGVICVVLVMLIDPWVSALTAGMPTVAAVIAAFLLLVLFVADIVFTVLNIGAVKKRLLKLKTMAEGISERFKLTAEEFSDGLAGTFGAEEEDEELLNYRGISRRLRRNRLITSFPKLQMGKLSAQIAELKRLIKRKHD